MQFAVMHGGIEFDTVIMSKYFRCLETKLNVRVVAHSTRVSNFNDQDSLLGSLRMARGRFTQCNTGNFGKLKIFRSGRGKG